MLTVITIDHIQATKNGYKLVLIYEKDNKRTSYYGKIEVHTDENVKLWYVSISDEKDIRQIQKYLDKNKLQVITGATGVR